MKATGIVRRIDDLGRIVIPKEIRRTMRIREGDPMEIFTSREGEILLKKYSPVGELSEFAITLAESMAQTIGALVCVTDRDYVIAASGAGKKNYDGKILEREFQVAIDNRCSQTMLETDTIRLIEGDKGEYASQTIATIISHGDSIGAVVILSKETEKNKTDAFLQLAKTMAGFLGKHMEQ